MNVVFSSATQLASAIQAKQISATKVPKAHSTQIDKHNRALNAIVTMDVERSCDRAQKADEAPARGGRFICNR